MFFRLKNARSSVSNVLTSVFCRQEMTSLLSMDLLVVALRALRSGVYGTGGKWLSSSFAHPQTSIYMWSCYSEGPYYTALKPLCYLHLPWHMCWC